MSDSKNKDTRKLPWVTPVATVTEIAVSTKGGFLKSTVEAAVYYPS